MQQRSNPLGYLNSNEVASSVKIQDIFLNLFFWDHRSSHKFSFFAEFLKLLEVLFINAFKNLINKSSSDLFVQCRLSTAQLINKFHELPSMSITFALKRHWLQMPWCIHQQIELIFLNLFNYLHQLVIFSDIKQSFRIFSKLLFSFPNIFFEQQFLISSVQIREESFDKLCAKNAIINLFLFFSCDRIIKHTGGIFDHGFVLWTTDFGIFGFL